MAPTLSRIAAALATAAALAAAPAHAATVTFDYLASGAGGATVSGAFGWETNTPDSRPEAHIGRYIGAGFLSALVSGGAQDGVSVNLDNLVITTVDGVPGQSIDTVSVLFSPTFISLNDFDGLGLTSAALPTALNFGEFNQAHDVLRLAVHAAGTQLFYTVTSFALRHPGPAAVPTPGTAALVIAALFAAWGARRRAGV